MVKISQKGGFPKLNFKIILKKHILREPWAKLKICLNFFGQSGVSDGLLCLKMKEKKPKSLHAIA
jgi:hypothetical protein